MAIQIDFASAKITVSAAGAAPALSVGSQRAATHLTQGFGDPDSKLGLTGHAFKITGEVDVVVDNRSEVDDILGRPKWTFNFIQVAKFNTSGMFWAGRRSSEGSVGVVPSTPPATPANQVFSLDSQAGPSPFISTEPPTGSAGRKDGKFVVHVIGQMGDHPHARCLLQVRNNRTKAPNFLFHRIWDHEFISVFMARDDKGVLQPPLAHVHWRVRFEARFKWAGNRPVGVLNGAGQALQFDPPVLGGPSDPAVQAIVANPRPPHTNDIEAAAINNSVRPPNRSDNPTWFTNVPPDFFT